MKILFISEEYLKEKSAIEQNADPELLKNTIAVVQDMQLRPVIGDALYEQLGDAIYALKTNGVALPSMSKLLIDEYIKPFLMYSVLVDIILIGNYRVSNKGVLKLSDTNASNPSTAEINHVKNYYEGYLSHYKKRLIDFLYENKLLKPGADTNTTSNKGGWFLEKDSYQPASYEGNQIDLEEIDPVWNLEKSDYYTKASVDGLIEGLNTLPGSGLSKTGDTFNLGGDTTGNTQIYLPTNNSFELRKGTREGYGEHMSLLMNDNRVVTVAENQFGDAEVEVSPNFIHFGTNGGPSWNYLAYAEVSGAHFKMRAWGDSDEGYTFEIQDDQDYQGYFMHGMDQSETNKEYVVMKDANSKLWQVPISNFATSSNAVMIESTQTITGPKTFTQNVTAPSLMSTNNLELYGFGTYKMTVGSSDLAGFAALSNLRSISGNGLSVNSCANIGNGPSPINITGGTIGFVNRVGATSTEAMRITGTNMLLGTTTDNGQRLQVSGNMALVGTGGGYIYGDTTNAYVRLSHNSGAMLGYTTSYFTIGGAGYGFNANLGNGNRSYINYRCASGMRISDFDTATDPQSDGLQAVIALTSSTKGFLPPRMTTTQRNAIPTPPAGLILYNNTTNTMNYWNGTAWISF